MTLYTVSYLDAPNQPIMDIDQDNSSAVEQPFQPIIFEDILAHGAFMATSEIRLERLDLPMMANPSGRPVGLAALREATARVLGHGPNKRGATAKQQAMPQLSDIRSLIPQEPITAMYFDMVKRTPMFKGIQQSFADSQKVITSKEAADLIRAAKPENACGGFKAGRQGSDLHHSGKGLNSSISRHSSTLSGTGLTLPILNWGWCGF